MSDRYICSECSKTYRETDRFIEHCRLTGHGWQDEDDEGAVGAVREHEGTN